MELKNNDDIKCERYDLFSKLTATRTSGQILYANTWVDPCCIASEQ